VHLQAAKPKGDKAKRGPVPQLQLLHNITGSFRPGVLTALMGVSGAHPAWISEQHVWAAAALAMPSPGTVLLSCCYCSIGYEKLKPFDAEH
jgi:hypothetical protein